MEGTAIFMTLSIGPRITGAVTVVLVVDELQRLGKGIILLSYKRYRHNCDAGGWHW